MKEKEFNDHIQEDGVWILDKDKKFDYSDGKETEDYILNVISNSSDISIGSKELKEKIVDWPTLYHLSPKRVDLLRSFKHLLTGKILEVGAGCGAITRFIAETADTVFALEGSLARAKIIKERCRDLRNVETICGNFNDFDTVERFNVVTLIGVLEYAGSFSDDVAPWHKLLEKARSLLSPDGILIIAIENQLGLKYFAGIPEDHLNRPFAGIENIYDHKSVKTFGKSALEKILKECGFSQIDFYYPFPDYKFPECIVTTEALSDMNINIADILKTRLYTNIENQYNTTFNLSKAIYPIIENQVADQLSNSFLVFASRNPPEKEVSPFLVTTFASDREKHFSKQNILTKSQEGYSVKKIPSYPNEQTPGSRQIVLQRLSDEPYYKGELFSNQVIGILENDGWTFEEIADWAAPWLEELKKKAFTQAGGLFIPGVYYDATPFNTIVTPEKDLTFFDLEWEVQEPLPLTFIVFRAIYYTIFQIRYLGHGPKPFETFSQLTLEALSHFFPDSQNDLENFIKIEQKIQNEITGIFSDEFFSKKTNTTGLRGTSPQNILATPNQIQVQLFWAYEPFGFSEEESLIQTANILTPQKVTFILGASKHPIKFVRLDIGSTPGAINIHNIQIRDTYNHILWKWDFASPEYKSNLFLIKAAPYNDAPAIQVALTEDPQLIFSMDDQIPDTTGKILIIDLFISQLTQLQYTEITQSIDFFSEASILPEEGPIQPVNTSKDQAQSIYQILEEKKSTIESLMACFQQSDLYIRTETDIQKQKIDQLLSYNQELQTYMGKISEEWNKNMAEKDKAIQDLLKIKQQQNNYIQDITAKLEDSEKRKNLLYTELETLKKNNAAILSELEAVTQKYNEDGILKIFVNRYF